MQRLWEEDIREFTPQNMDAHKKAFQDTVNLTHEVFRQGGILETQFGKAHRKSQYSMAMDVARAFQDGKHLAAEAGTGTGKTLAYGVPAAILGILHPGVPEEKEDPGDGPAFVLRPLQTVISVHTLALQDQLEGDFQLIGDITEAATGKRPLAIRVSGRENYFCEVTAQLLANESQEEKIQKMAEHLLKEFLSLKSEGKIKTGLTSELPSWPSVAPEMRKMFTANDLNCALHKGKALCNYDRAKALMPKAHLIAINHNLMALGWPGTWHQKVIDEAHTLEPVVVDSTAQETSIDKLERAANKPNVAKRGPNGVPFYLEKLALEIVESAKDVEKCIATNKIRRVRGPMEKDIIEPLREQLDLIIAETARGLQGIPAIESPTTTDIKDYFEKGKTPNLRSSGDIGKVMDALRNIKNFYAHTSTFLEFARGPSEDKPTLVYWTEEPQGNSGKPSIRITEADPKPALKNLHSGSPSIMTSATLAGPKGLQSFVQSQGLTEKSCKMGEYPAPFDLEEKMRVIIPKGMPEPGKQEREWKTALPSFILNAIEETENLPGKGGTLVLLTSKADMNAAAEAIGPVLQSKRTPLLVQDGSLERREMIDRMKNHGNSVILGLESFWTGVDIPGNALRHVVICRIPFQVPSPLNDARKEIAEAQGLNPFEEVDLRHAVNTFRQGVGRLIRTTTDDGLISVLDPRVVTKGYGKTLLNGLPEPSQSYEDHEPIRAQESFRSNNFRYQKSERSQDSGSNKLDEPWRLR